MIYLTSDTHINHNRGFIYEPRGFKTVEEMNEAIVARWNAIVKPEDEVYHLGDVMLGGPNSEDGLNYLKQLNGKIHITIGNHDTNKRIELYKNLSNVVEVKQALKLDYNGYHFFMCHYPSFTGCLQHEDLKKTTCNLFGHTHQHTNFYQNIPFMYHVGVDSHNCTPISIDEVIADMENEVKECIKCL